VKFGSRKRDTTTSGTNFPAGAHCVIRKQTGKIMKFRLRNMKLISTTFIQWTGKV